MKRKKIMKHKLNVISLARLLGKLPPASPDKGIYSVALPSRLEELNGVGMTAPAERSSIILSFEAVKYANEIEQWYEWELLNVRDLV